MRDASTIAVAELYQAIRHEHWHGKTFRQFWTWFNARCIDVVGSADAADLDALGSELMAVRDAVDAAGYCVPSDRLDAVIDAAD
ncbi:hypothetical protein [Luteimonas deserti]|uniref:Uncharacterized protein n=1 Tax=Luteimonas deserti TaxID=2752306 RepID=A0A7Z0QQE2_9GAMM|nr:hypothetical protein [Luteimonas deserti]NYZ62936.1 hypothetical protein [Luteimonas deserti]